MKKVITKYLCDLCGKEGAKQYTTVVEFQTEQTEGRHVEPYLEQSKIDLCQECAKKVFIIKAEGAQGNNKYWINNGRG